MKKRLFFMTLIFVTFLCTSCTLQSKLFGKQGAVSGNLIGEEKAKELAVSRVAGATENDIREFEMDRSDGRVEYEGEIYYEGMKYSFEMDAYSGDILEWEAETIYN